MQVVSEARYRSVESLMLETVGHMWFYCDTHGNVHARRIYMRDLIPVHADFTS